MASYLNDRLRTLAWWRRVVSYCGWRGHDNDVSAWRDVVICMMCDIMEGTRWHYQCGIVADSVTLFSISGSVTRLSTLPTLVCVG